MRTSRVMARLVGRGRELDLVERLIGLHRLVTLTGVSGTGKTRLASEIARRATSEFVWTELAPCSERLPVTQQVAAALGLRETSERESVDALIEALQERELLLVLDNCEHVIETSSALADTLLSHCAKLRILVTSREPLAIAGEQVCPVPPLAQSEAEELFADRAAAVDPSFVMTETSAPFVAEICRRLDGIPLAIELAAARIRVLTPEQIAARLEDRFAILSGGARTAIARHRTLRAAVDWSFALLTESEQTLLARLSVFAGTFSLEAVEAVCTDETIGVADVLDLLTGLVDKSLVVATSCGSAVRYSLLETIRQYAAERVAQDAQELRRRHAAAFLDIVRAALPELLSASVAALDRLDPDHDNVRTAMCWSLEHAPDAIALPLAAAFRWYWYYRILWSEGSRWMQQVLERASGGDAHDRASVIAGAGTFAGYLGDLASSRTYLEQAVVLWRELGDERQLAFTSSALAHVLTNLDELDAAQTMAAEAVGLARRSGMTWDLGYCLTNAAAFVAQGRGALEEADRHLEEVQSIWQNPPHPLGEPFVLNARAMLAIRRGGHPAAARLARAALASTRERREVWFSSRSLRIIAFTTANDPLRAARLCGAADAMLRSIAAGMLVHERAEHERLLARLREALPPETLEAALLEGSRMAFEDACTLAFEDDGSAAGIRVRDLGPLQLVIDGKPVSAEGPSSGRARELLVYLLAHPEGRTREQVGVAFWPDSTTEQIKNSFHVAMHRLRKILGNPDAIRSDGGRYRFDPSLACAVDSRRFETEMLAALHEQSHGKLEAALALYDGDFLQGDDAGEWSIPIRTRLRQLYLRGLFALAQSFESRGRYADAADTYARLLAREPFHEPACRQLMICRARLGARSESLVVYRKLEQRLREEMKAAPEAETVRLYTRLQQNEAV